MKVITFDIPMKVKLFKANSYSDNFILLDKDPGTPESCASKIVAAGEQKCGTMEFMSWAPSSIESAGCYCYTSMNGEFSSLEDHNVYIIELEGINVVTLYDRPEYQGRSITFPVGKYGCSFTDENKFDDQMQSMKVPEGFSVTLYEHCYSGKSEVFKGPIESMQGGDFSGIVSSLEVEEVIGGCCQLSETDNKCANFEYENG
jgi:hypothetical protein